MKITLYHLTGSARGRTQFIDAAVRHQAQLIVISSRGIKAIKRFLLGSVSEKVLVYASIPY